MPIFRDEAEPWVQIRSNLLFPTLTSPLLCLSCKDWQWWSCVLHVVLDPEGFTESQGDKKALLQATYM